MKIRLAKPKDARDIVYISKKTWLDTYPNEEYGINYEDIEKKFANFEEKVQKNKERFKKNSIEKRYWVAEVGEKVVGFLFIKDEKNLGAMYILPEYQRRRIGSALMKKFLDYCKNSEEVFVEVAVYNKEAIDFYKSFGFKILKDSLKEDNHIMPSVVMKKDSF